MSYQKTWRIVRVSDAFTGLPKYVDRKRVGAVVRNPWPLEEGVPLVLTYWGGPKDGSRIEHSLISTVEETNEGHMIVTTKHNTLVELAPYEEEAHA